MEKKKLPKDHNYGTGASKNKSFFIYLFFPTQRPLGEICRKTKSDKLENNSEIKVCLMRRRTGGRMGGKQRAIFHADSCSVQEKREVFLPYVHRMQLTAHIRKGLLKRGNNEKERHRAVQYVPLLRLAGSLLSAGTTDLLSPHRFHKD